MGRKAFGLIVALLVTATALPVSAQTYQGGVRGAVRDSSDVVTGADVALTNEETNLTRTTVTNAVGEYAFPNVLPGLYRLRASLTGFSTFESRGIRIGTQDFVTLDLSLTIGEIRETVIVIGASPVIDTTSASVGTLFDRAALETLPNEGRIPFSISVIPANVVPTGILQVVCGQVPRHVVQTTKPDYGPDLDEGPLARPVVLPSNLEVAPVFRLFLDKMFQASPTFRGQWRRLAAGTGLHVSVLVEDLPRPASSSKARTVLGHQDGSLVSARVYLKPSVDAAELVAHELEHILEQLDGVDLQAQAGNGVVWKAGDGAFETRRAIEAGRRVTREITTGADIADVRHLPHENHADRLTTVVQHDRNATPSSVRSARVSGSGRYVVFVSSAQLVEADRNQLGDVYVLDVATGACTLESAGPGGSPGNGESLSPDISRDGRYVVFESAAGNLLDAAVLPGIFRVFLRDRQNGVTRLLSANANGEPANGTSGNPVISADGTVVVFESTATDLVESGDTARSSVGIYLVQLTSGLHTRLDLTSAGGRRAGQSMSPAVSADGRFVAFVSKADLTCGEASPCHTEPSDNKGVAAIYLRDTHTSITRRITSSYGGGAPNGPSYHPAISGDGRHVAFVSEASNLTPDSTVRTAHICVHDLDTGITDLVTRTPSGRPVNGPSLRPALSRDGATVAFQSLASNLVCEGKCQDGQPDINLVWDVFVYDRFARRTARVSTDIGEEWMENSRAPSLDDAGQVIAFGSRHPLNGRDEARDEDLYVYRLPARSASR